MKNNIINIATKHRLDFNRQPAIRIVTLRVNNLNVVSISYYSVPYLSDNINSKL